MSANLRTFKKGESRFYVDDSTGATAPGVTSILNMLPKGFLQYWAAKMTAECAVDNIQSVVGLAMNDRQGAIDYLKGAARRSTKEAADFGTDSHDLFERMARGEGTGRVHPELRIMAQHFQEFLDDVQPEFIHLEQTVWNDNPSYAGSFDAIMKVDGETVITDWKTTRSGVHEEVALQLTAYANAERIILSETGESIPMPTIDAGAVLHVRPEGWKLVPAKLSPELFEIFKALAQVFRWERELKRGVIGRPVAFGGSQETGSQRRK